MKSAPIRLIAMAAFAAVTLICCGFSFAQELPSCDDETVTYSKFDEHFAARMTVQSGSLSVPTVGEKQFSPQKTRWIIVSKPDTTKPGPWTTVVWVSRSRGGVSQKLTFIDHGSSGPYLQWLNEKLLYGQVWWGRLGSTDFVFDADRKRFIYREMANYVQMVQPCQ
jgi:hypothetical protein